MKTLRVIMLLFAAGAMTTISAFASDPFEKTLTGQLEGLYCIYAEALCAIDNRDPHIALELDFVLLLQNGDHYLLTNVPREVKIQFVGKEIEVTGIVQEEYRAITAKTLKVKVGGKYKITWTPQSKDRKWRDWRERFYEGETEN